MGDTVLNIAASGLTAATRRLEASASNTANVFSTGRVGAQPGEGDAAFQAQTVVQSSVEAGSSNGASGAGAGAGVRARITPTSSPVQLAFDPNSPLANSDGFVEAPAVDLGQEAATQISARAAFSASAALIRAADEQTDALLDITS